MTPPPLVFYNRPNSRLSRFHKNVLTSPLTIDPWETDLMTLLRQHSTPPLNLYTVSNTIINYCQSTPGVSPHPSDSDIVFTDTLLQSIMNSDTIHVSQLFRHLLPKVHIHLSSDTEQTLDHRLWQISGRPVLTKLLPLPQIVPNLLPPPLNQSWNRICTPNHLYYHPDTLPSLVRTCITHLHQHAEHSHNNKNIFHSFSDPLFLLFQRNIIHVTQILELVITKQIELQMLHHLSSTNTTEPFKLQTDLLLNFFLVDLLYPNKTLPEQSPPSDNDSIPPLQTETETDSNTEFEPGSPSNNSDHWSTASHSTPNLRPITVIPLLKPPTPTSPADTSDVDQPQTHTLTPPTTCITCHTTKPNNLPHCSQCWLHLRTLRPPLKKPHKRPYPHTPTPPSPPTPSPGQPLCFLCETQPRDCAHVHGHMAHILSCYDCARRALKTTRRCPVCNQTVSSITKLTYS